MRKAIEEVPDGTYYAETFIDGFLDSEDANLKDIKIAASINVKGSNLKVDLAGTSNQIDN